MKKRRAIDWIVCAAGSGQRFVDQGIDVPKLWIRLEGRTMLERALACLPVVPGDAITIILQESSSQSALENEIASLFPWAKLRWVRLKKKTSGQLSTFLKIRKFLSPRRSVAIWNCDTAFKSLDFEQCLAKDDWEGLVPCGKLPGESWSFFKVDRAFRLQDVREKKRIAPWASVGMYYFRNSSALLKAADKVLAQKPAQGTKEYFVSAVYPVMLAGGSRIKVCPTEVFLPFGTPEQVQDYWAVSINELRKDNRRALP